MAAKDTGVPFWWLVLFILLAIGAGVGAVMAVGGDLMGSILLPFV